MTAAALDTLRPGLMSFSMSSALKPEATSTSRTEPSLICSKVQRVVELGLAETARRESGASRKAVLTSRSPQGPGLAFQEGSFVSPAPSTGAVSAAIAMNADASHKEVAEAQAFFAKTMENFQEQLSSEDVERLGIRIQLKEAFKDLNKTFKKQDGKDYGRFYQAGLIGMYNKGNWDLAKHRQVDPKKLYETMSRTELAANLFRVTQTEERIKNEALTGQSKLEKAHKDVGKEVREMVKRNTGVYPEALPQAELPAPKIESQLKKAHKKLKKMDE